ncbi:MAG: NAD(P)-binding domain-containing protein [Methanobacterium sp.]|uniref:pyrroline-5-carboxylate reductase dimerization domain-containing protein n=1 Tax=Methanobacterium sp. TaxID=2164 RepID=UPI003D64DA52|nr:NAD(P)-binding domain-containing protein [Methanobacterium sp.]
MAKIGFIGYGSMGSMIITGFLSSNALKPDEIIISNRTKSKLYNIKKEYPEIEIAENNLFLADECEKIFIFVGTNAVKEVIEDIHTKISDKAHIIYIAAALTIENVESVFQGKISKVIPNLTSEVSEGVSLICHNEKVNEIEAEFVNKLFNSISTVKIIEEDDFEVGSDLTSCAPAFIAEIFMEFAEASVKNSNFNQEDANDMVIKTLYGTAKLLHDKNMSFEELISRVATKGGITEDGIKVLENKLPGTFDELFKTTLDKHEQIKSELNCQYNKN